MAPVPASGAPGTSLPLRAWVRRASPATLTWAFRYEVEEGRAVLRVARPGVLIVPPARSRGHEDQLSADQLRASVLLYVPNGPGARRSCSLSRLDDRFLLELEPEVWTELRLEHEAQTAQDHLLPPATEEVISLTGAVDPALPTLIDMIDLARLIEKMPTPTLEDDDPAEGDHRGRRRRLRLDPRVRAAPTALRPPSAAAHHPELPGGAPAPAGPRPPLPSPPSPAPPPPTPPPLQAATQAPPRIALGDGPDSRHLTRHLRRQLERKDQELTELRARLEELEQRLAARR
jgi:hypothetical protein